MGKAYSLVSVSTIIAAALTRSPCIGKTLTLLPPDEYHDAVEHQRKYQKDLKCKQIIPRRIAIGIANYCSLLRYFNCHRIEPG